MSQTFTKVSFSLVVTPQEAALMDEIGATVLDIAALDAEGQTSTYQQMSEAFRTRFVAGEDGPFAAYLSLFTDPEFVELGISIETQALPDGQAQIYLRGHDVDVESLAAVLRAVCPSALPCGFTYAFGSDNLTNGDFGGGYALLGHAGVKIVDTTEALAAALLEDNEIQRSLVLASSHEEHGIVFWNETDGFGPLEMATAFSPAEANDLKEPCISRPVKWVNLPARRP